MSKVKAVEGIPKSKIIHRNRRIETKKKKNQRIHSCENGEYPYGTYYVKDENISRTYELKDIPEREAKKGHYEINKIPIYNEHNEIVKYKTSIKYIIDEIILVPEHSKKCVTSVKYIPLKVPILKRCSLNKKKYRKIAARRFRRNPIDVSNGSNYKKCYDIKWLIF